MFVTTVTSYVFQCVSKDAQTYMLVDKFQSISCESLVAILMHELSNVVLNIFGGFVFSKIKFNHGSKPITKLHQSHAALELANLKVSHKV